MTVLENKHAFTLLHTLSSHKHPFRLSYSIQWTGPAQSSTVVVIVAIVVQVSLLFSSSTLLAISLELYFIASHLFFIVFFFNTIRLSINLLIVVLSSYYNFKTYLL